jgi:hypothetical protein
MQKNYSFYDLQMEARELTSFMYQIIQKNAILAYEIQSLKSEINQFIEYYLQEVGHLFKGELNQDIIDDADEYSIILENFLASKVNAEEAMSSEIKSIYRKLVKKCHPDSNPNISDELIYQLNKAYQEQDLPLLLKIEYVINNDYKVKFNNIADLQKIRIKYQELQLQTDRLEDEKYNIIQSDEYMLWKKAMYLKECGKDIIEQVKNSINYNNLQFVAA